MRAFFRGWKRKIGTLTLLLACVLLCGWGRSQIAWDGVTYFSGRVRTDSLYSRNAVFGWGRSDSKTPCSDSDLHAFKWNSARVSLDQTSKSDRILDPVSRWKSWGVERSEMEVGDVRWVMLEVSYWTMIIPLTLLSAWLLFAKTSQNLPE